MCLTACVTQVEFPPSLDRADALARQGDPSSAARVYEQLAQQNSGAHRDDLVFSAAHAYLAAHLPDQAVRVLGLIEEPLTPAQSMQRALLEVEIDLARGQGEQAWQRLNALTLPRTPAEAAAFLKLKQRAAFATGRLPAAVAAEDQLEPWLQNAQELRQSRSELLASLREASEHGAKIEPRSSGDAVVRGWLELAPLAAAVARDQSGATADIQAWLARHPNHPAGEVVRTQLLLKRAPQPLEATAPATAPPTLPATPVGPGELIALLLPAEGRQAAAGTSVRDGFMTAYYQTPVAQRPRLRIYDTSQGSAAEAISRAVQEGASFIVGPLAREEVVAAADFPGRHTPILTLNFLPPEHSVPPDFYQFALSPEDEARSAARRILEDGHRGGVVLVPSGDWGTRVLAAFKQEIEAGGGTLLATATVDAAETDYSDSVTRVLKINESRARHLRLEQILGSKLQFEPRRRADIEFLFTPAQVATERLLRPQLRFHYAGPIPTYATSDAFEPDPRANQDLEGLIFPDMPWMLGGELAEAVRSAAKDAWPGGGPRRGRLFAFGFDAYRLALALRGGGGPTAQIDGLTGRLTLDREGRVHRDLNWAQLHNGEVRLLPAAGPPAAAAQ
jgi:outer membrane PBP1 activator LpoA protein